MRTKTVLTVVSATAALGAGGAVATNAAASGVATSSASSSHIAGPATKHVEGRIVAVSSQARTFHVRDRERLRARHDSRGAGIRNAAAGSDDPVGRDVGDDRGDGRGRDDGPGHDQGDERGRDDGAGHDQGDDHGPRHGRH